MGQLWGTLVGVVSSTLVYSLILEWNADKIIVLGEGQWANLGAEGSHLLAQLFGQYVPTNPAVSIPPTHSTHPFRAPIPRTHSTHPFRAQRDIQGLYTQRCEFALPVVTQSPLHYARIVMQWCSHAAMLPCLRWLSCVCTTGSTTGTCTGSTMGCR